MTNRAQVAWVEENVDLIEGPVAELGSRLPVRKGNKVKSYDLKRIVSVEWVGFDMQPGQLVDEVADLSVGFDPKWSGHFNTVLCLSVMEHVRDVFSFAKVIQGMLAPGGHLFVAVPWVWRYHGHPHDYWRFTPEALKFLFDGMKFMKGRSRVAYHEGDVTSKFSLTLTRPYVPAKQKALRPCEVQMVFRRPLVQSPTVDRGIVENVEQAERSSCNSSNFTQLT